MKTLGLKHGHLVYARFVHRDAQGEVLWESGWTPNELADEGEKLILDVFLRAAAAPASFRVRLFGDTPVDTDSLASLQNEPGGNTGYVPPTINRDATVDGWPTLDNIGGDFFATSRTMTFRATGPGQYPLIRNAALCTTSDNTGKLIDYTALSDPRSLKSGETIDVIYQPGLS